MALGTNILDPIRSFCFSVEIGGIVMNFQEVSGADVSIDVIEYRDGNDILTNRKYSGLSKYGNLTLKRGVTTGTDDANYDAFVGWIDNCAQKFVTDSDKKQVIVNALDDEGTTIASWTFDKAWPVKYTAPTFNAHSSEMAIETLELAHEGYTTNTSMRSV